jgi:hypothetical protein
LHHLKHNTGIEMAELQIWTNKTLDTGLESNRRLFVDNNGSPVNMSVAEKALGKPDIKLHGSSNWKNGYNDGSIGIDVDARGEPVKKPEGQFVPVSVINHFKPDPEIGK